MSNYYLCPKPFGDRKGDADGQLGWAKEMISQSKQYLRLQPAFTYIQQGLDLVNGDLDNPKIQTLSDVKLDLVVRNIKELVAAQSNVRIIPSFKTEIDEFKNQESVLNKLYMAWQTMTFADRALRKTWQYACAGGTGYLGIRWEPNFWYRGKGDIVLDSYGPLDVLPLGLPRNHNLQRAYAVAVRVETPWHEVVRRYPEYIDKIKPSRENSKGRGGNVVSAAVKYASAALRKFGPGATQENEPAPWAMCDVYHIYIDDDSVNYTGRPVLMGDPGTSWEYLVPYVGQEIVKGYRVDGTPRLEKAMAADCLLYPNRRKMVAIDDLVLNPDPMRQVNEYWHGKVPVIQFKPDDWPWCFLGFPLTKAGYLLEKANNELMRSTVDAGNVRLSPPRAYDRNTMAQSLAQVLNTRIPNQVLGVDMTFGGADQIKPLLPVEFYNIPAIIPELIQANEERITKQMGVADAQALARSRQMPSSDSLEKIMDSMGPLIKDQSRNMESGVRDEGEMWKSLVFQFYHAPRLMEILGKDGVAEETWQYKPGDLIPEKIPNARPDAPLFERARIHSNNFVFSVTPYSLHELNSVNRKLFHLQLQRSGYPIDWWTLADVFDIKDFGKLPLVDDPDNPGHKREALTVLEKWMAQKEIEIRFAAAAQGAAQQAAAQHGPPGASGPSPGGGSGGGPGGVGPHQPEGHPPSAQNPPAIEQKADGRVTIRESKR